MKRALETELQRWKDKEEHLPILLRGARQVGKSHLVEHFGASHFEDVAVVDFESRPELKEAFSTQDPKKIITRLEFALRKSIKPHTSLLFLDEIQLCPEALSSLRYFKEKMPALHVIAAGSLLEFILQEETFSFPVGRVEFLYLHPLSFLEYMEAAAPFITQHLSSFNLKNLPTNLEHQEMLKWIRRYLFVGGMPAAVAASLKEDSLLETQRVHHRILQAYTNDFGKYGKKTQHKYLQLIFQKSLALIGQILKYSRLDEEIRARELKPALDLLCKAGLLQQVFATTAAGVPLHAHLREDRFKLLYLDVGLLQTATRVDASSFFDQEILQINSGMIAEQFVGQELSAYAPPYQNASLLFWENTQGGQAEIDFVLPLGSSMLPLEVKGGTTGTLRSLHSFLKNKPVKGGVRVSAHPLSLHGNMLSVPFYLIERLPELYKEAFS